MKWIYYKTFHEFFLLQDFSIDCCRKFFCPHKLLFRYENPTESGEQKIATCLVCYLKFYSVTLKFMATHRRYCKAVDHVRDLEVAVRTMEGHQMAFQTPIQHIQAYRPNSTTISASAANGGLNDTSSTLNQMPFHERNANIFGANINHQLCSTVLMEDSMGHW